MKRFFGFLGLLCLFFGAGAQENIVGKGIKVGEGVPDVEVTGVKGLRLGGKEVSAFHLSELKGKLVILDFWATWCQPCRAMVPVIDSLQKVFAGKVVFLPVTYQPEAVVGPVLLEMQRQHPFTLPGVTGDKVLNGMFPHRFLPHFVWIGGDGRVRAITEEKEVTALNIRSVMEKGNAVLAEKRDLHIPYDKGKLLLIGGNGGNGSAITYHSLLSGYIPGLPAGMDRTLPDSVKGLRFNIRNVPFTWLVRMAYSDHRWFANSRIKLLTADSGKMTSSLSGQDYERWLAGGNGWCYELQVPPALMNRAYDLMQEDVRRLFPQYRVGVERALTRCLALVRTSSSDKLASAGGKSSAEVSPFGCDLRNCRLGQLLVRLDVQYLQDFPLPVIDETGYNKPVDLSLHAPMSDVKAMNRELARYDLKFVEKMAPADLLIVRDNPENL